MIKSPSLSWSYIQIILIISIWTVHVVIFTFIITLRSLLLVSLRIPIDHCFPLPMMRHKLQYVDSFFQYLHLHQTLVHSGLLEDSCGDWLVDGCQIGRCVDPHSYWRSRIAPNMLHSWSRQWIVARMNKWLIIHIKQDNTHVLQDPLQLARCWLSRDLEDQRQEQVYVV